MQCRSTSYTSNISSKKQHLCLLSFLWVWFWTLFWGGFWQLCNTQICIHNSLADCRATLRCGPITFQTDTRCSHSCVVICSEKGVNYCLCFVLLDLGNAVLCNSKFWSFKNVKRGKTFFKEIFNKLKSRYPVLLIYYVYHTKEHIKWVK